MIKEKEKTKEETRTLLRKCQRKICNCFSTIIICSICEFSFSFSFLFLFSSLKYGRVEMQKEPILLFRHSRTGGPAIKQQKKTHLLFLFSFFCLIISFCRLWKKFNWRNDEELRWSELKKIAKANRIKNECEKSVTIFSRWFIFFSHSSSHGTLINAYVWHELNTFSIIFSITHIFFLFYFPRMKMQKKCEQKKTVERVKKVSVLFAAVLVLAFPFIYWNSIVCLWFFDFCHVASFKISLSHLSLLIEP